MERLSKQSRKLKLNVPDEEGQLSFGFARGGPREGAGRKAIGITRKVSLTLPTDLWERIDELAAERAATRSETIRDLLREALPRERA